MQTLRKFFRRPKLLILPLFILLAIVYFMLSGSSESSDPSDIDALAPVEVLADGFQEPTGVLVDHNGAIFVSDRNSGDVFRIVGADIRPIVTGLRKPVGIAFNGQGRLLVVEEERGRLLRLETDSRLTVLAQRMRKPRFLAVAADGNLYITAKGLRRDGEGDDDDEDEERGEAILRLTTAGELTVWVEGFEKPQGIVVHERTAYVVAKRIRGEGGEREGGIFQIPIQPDGRPGPITRLSQREIKKPFGIVRDRLGAFYVSAEEISLDREFEGVIAKVSSTGQVTRFASRLREPRGIALDNQGNLLVADDRGDRRGRILRFRAPSPPTVAVPQFTNRSPLTVAGTTKPNSRIDAFLNDSTVPITVSTQDGSFSLTLNLKLNTQNFLDVFTTAHSGQGLTSAPAEFTIIHDNIAPLIANVQPANGSFLNNPRPLIRADFSDHLSGIDLSKLEIHLDGFAVTSQAQITASGFTLNPLNPLSEGVHTVSVSIADRAGNSASASTTFTIDVTAPLITNLSPVHGSIVTTARPLISAQFSDNFGINLASVRILLDGADVTSQAQITTSGFTLNPLNPLTQGQHTVTVSVSDRAGNSASASSSFTVSLGPQLNSIGNKIVNLGETLTFTVSATNPGGGGVTLFVSPLPLPNHAAFNAATGLFTFTPDTTQVGSFQLTFSAVSGAQSSSETITITVPSPPPGGVTGVRGRVYNLNNTPLGNVKVTLKSSGHTAFSGSDGFFILSGVPSGRQELIINGRQANLGVFAILAVPADLIEGVLNNLRSPITLPDVDVAAEVPVSPVFTTVVSNPSVPGVALTIAGGTAKNSDGTPFTGKLSINPVPDYGRPESRPEELRPGMAITIQPAGVRFNPPARLTFPNADGMPPGKELNLWSLSPDTGTFNLVGKGVVTQDRLSIITVEGGVSASAWHFFLASSPTPASAASGNRYCASGNCPVSSEANLEEGSLFLSHALPSYRSLGQSRSLSLTYSSLTADARPIISLDTTLSVRAAVPNTFSTKLEVGGVQQGGEIFTDTRSLPEDRDSTSRLSVQFDASNLSTGRYPYKATIFSNYLNSSIGGITNGNVIVLNQKKSAFGSGWALTDLQQLHVQGDGSLLLTTGDGTALFFSGGPSTFTSPSGEFSILIRNANGTYTRTLKDGSKFNFSFQGLQTSVVDRNSNTTSYTYNGTGRLLTITDPAGLVTTFTYSGEKIQKITNAAGRETLFQHDAQGNLIGITNPDKTSVSYLYDGKGHVVQFTDERGNRTTYAYDFAGRFSQSTKPGGETRSLTSSKLQGLANTAGGQGTPINPAPVVRTEAATSSLTDGKGNRTTFTLNALGQIASQIDALGNTTLIERDSNGNPTKITRPNGAVVTMAYDSRGNLLNSTDPVNGTTTFTYDPNFNQVKSIKDPKNQTTTINYDLKGNPIEIIDALGNRTQMTYEARGLLTSVTSAVGTPQQNTTSFTYDARGNLLTTTDPRGNVTTLAYDNAGNVFRSTDGEGRVTEFTYDSFNRLISVLDPSVNVTRYTYDAKGNLTQVTDAKAQRTTFTYDALDRLISATNPFGLVETFTYDANGNLVSTTNRNRQSIGFDYDALNRLIRKTRPPTSTEVGSQVTNFSYDSVGNLRAVVNPVIGVFNQYDLANRLVSSTSSTEEAVAGIFVQINQDTLIDENNRQFEGRSLQVNSRTLTVDGTHTFANLILVNGAVLTHSPTTANRIGRLDLRVTGTLQIDVTSRIDVTGRGFLGGNQPGNPFGGDGMTVGFQRGSTGTSGGSYGGLGGSSRGSSNSVYGDLRNPNEPGSGGAAPNAPGGNGGGLIRVVAQTIQLDGVIKADGATPQFYGGGSGGGIRLDVGILRGTGSISANGGNGQRDNGGGGGGGRVAIYYQDATGFDFNKVTAFGVSGNFAPNGGAGTIYLQGPGREMGELVVDNNNIVPVTQSTPILSSLSGLLSLSNLRAKRAARLRVDDQVNLTGTLEVASGAEFIPAKRVISSTTQINTGGVITQLPTTGSAFFKVDLNTNTLTIDATSRIDVSGRGFLGGQQPGNPFGGAGMTVGFQRGSTGLSGGSYGGLGGSSQGVANPVYGDFRNPNEPGSGGAAPNAPGANGGGLIRIVAQTVQLDGVIKADGATPQFYGGGSGGGIRLDAGILRGTGSISANGGNGQRDNGGGGGGGRIAIYFQSLIGFDLQTQVTAFGGTGNGAPNGQNGTVFTQQTLAMRSPIDDEAPVMTAEHEPRPTNHDAQRLASLAMPVVELKPKEGAPKIPDFRELIAEMRAEIPQAERPQRRVFSPSELNTQNSELKTEHTNLYLALVSSSSFGSSVLPNPKSKIENPKSQEDFDPIYTYDLNGNRISMIDPTGITNYTYDALNRLTSITNNRGFTTTFTYDALGRRTSMTHGNAVVTSYSYDAASQLTRLAHQLGVTTIDSFDYTYDRVGNRRTKADRNGSYNYTYDALNRLVQAVNPLPTNPLETYTYDPVGNRTNSNQNGSSIFNQANQLTEDANFTYQYDANGNLTRKTARVGGAFTSYEYDAENKLVRVVTPGKTVNYKYDGLGRRVEKEIIEVTTTVRRYIYDNEDILLELDGSNNITARYTHGPGIDEPLVMEKGGVSFFYHADGLGSITELTDASGIVVKSYTYSSFGKIESETNPTFFQPYTFTGREFDPETGLYHYRKRTLDSNSGRFTSEDPIKFSGGINFYAYVGNNPVRLVDPFGLEPCLDCPGGRWRGIGINAGGVLGHLGYSSATVTVFCVSNPSLTAPLVIRNVFLGVGIGGGIGVSFVQIEGATKISELYNAPAGGGVETTPTAFGGFGAAGSGVGASVNKGGFEAGFGIGGGAGVGVNFTFRSPR